MKRPRSTSVHARPFAPALALLTSLVFACGGSPPPPAPVTPAGGGGLTASTVQPVVTAPVVSAAPLESAPPKHENHVAKAIEKAKGEADEEARGRQAMHGLSWTEKKHLPATVLKLLETAGDPGAKAADFNVQVQELVSKPPLAEGLEDLCGRPATNVLADLAKVDAKKRSEKLYADCKLSRRIKFAEADLPRMNASSILLVLAARELLAKHDAIVEGHEELVKYALYAFAQKK
ncbi:MAG: hypothetical protein U0174_06995 [Polyangiaceae bacterium]